MGLFKWSCSVLLFCLCLILVSCGSSSGPSYQPPPSQPQPPAFSSTPPSYAAEGHEYRYTVAATDPSGGQLTLTLSAAPTGATLTGSVLTWTPAREQSRKSHAFELTAKNQAGLTTRQNWNVAPSGSVEIVASYSLYAADGSVTRVPVDLSYSAPWAYRHNETNEWTSVPPATSGKLVIPNVPAGHYWLAWDPDAQPPYGSPTFWWTDASTLDLASVLLGRAPYWGIEQADIQGNITGLDTWDSTKLDLIWFNPNVDSIRTLLPSDGDITWTGTAHVSTSDPSKGDLPFVLEYRRDVPVGSTNVRAMATKSLALPNLVIGPGTTLVSGELTPISTDHSMPVRFDGAACTNSLNLSGPDPISFGFDLVTLIHPYSNTYVSDSMMPGLWWINEWGERSGLPSQNVIDLGTIPFANPFPAEWPLAVQVYFGADFLYAPNGVADTYLSNGNGYVTGELPRPGDPPLKPQLTPVTNIMVDGKNASNGSLVISNTGPTISWTAPAGANNIAGYSVTVIDFYGNNVWYRFGPIFTSETTFTLPHLFAPGGNHALLVTAYSDPFANMENLPFTWGFPSAWADAYTHLITITGSPATASAVRRGIPGSPGRAAAARIPMVPLIRLHPLANTPQLQRFMKQR